MRAGGTLRKPVIVWLVRHGDELERGDPVLVAQIEFALRAGHARTLR